MKSIPKSLLYVLAAAFVLRITWALVVYFNNPDGIWTYDSIGYWYLGRNLLEHSVFSQNSLPPFDPDYLRTPLYPLFLSLFQFFSFPNVTIVFVQQIMSVLTCYFTFRIGKEIFTQEKTALVAAFVMAIDVPSIVFSDLVLTETVFGLLFVIYCLLFITYLRSNDKRLLFYSSVVCGLLILCRPIAVFIPFVQMAILFFFGKQVVSSLVLSVLVTLAFVSPWLIRNKITFGEFSLSCLPSHNLLNHHAANILAEKNNISFNTANLQIRLEMLDKFKGDALRQPLAYAQFIRKESIKVIVQNPVIFLRQHLRNVFEFMVKPVRSYLDLQLGYKSTSIVTKILVGIQLGLLGIIYLAFARGIFRMKHQGPVIVFFLLLIIFFANMTVPPFSEARLRIPVMPLIALVAAAGFAGSLRKKEVLQPAGLE